MTEEADKPTTIDSAIADAFAKAEAAQAQAPKQVEDAQEAEPESASEEDVVEQPEEVEASAADEAEPEEDEDTDEPEDAAPEALTPDTLIDVPVNGEVYKHSLQELINSFSGNRFQKSKLDETMQLQRQLQSGLQEYQQRLEQVTQFAEQIEQAGIMREPQLPKWDPLNPIDSAEAVSQYQHDLAAYKAQQAELQAARHEAQAIAQARNAQAVQEQIQILAKEMPEFADPKTREQTQAQLAKYAMEVGNFRPEELANVTDARTVRILHKAMQYDKLMAEGREKTKPAAKVMKPGARPKRSGRADRKQRIQKAAQGGGIMSAIDAAFSQLE